MILLQIVGEEGPRIQGFKGLFPKDFISTFNILSILAMSLFSVPIQSKSYAKDISGLQFVNFCHKICKASSSNPWLSFFSIFIRLCDGGLLEPLAQTGQP
ncbi:MAG: hypothetical protein HKO91_03325 [Desulfobacterales bacterium]|nr:hypothetical protein [Desulfobacterales bacterium]